MSKKPNNLSDILGTEKSSEDVEKPSTSPIFPLTPSGPQFKI